jgi:murein DD-endopeptidase MepM/ murein hydrolase activator NlpD
MLGMNRRVKSTRIASYIALCALCLVAMAMACADAPESKTHSKSSQAGDSTNRAGEAVDSDIADYRLSVRPLSKTIANGQLAAFLLEIEGVGPAIQNVQGQLGPYQISPAKWSDNGRTWLVLAPVPVSSTKRSIQLRVHGTRIDGTDYTVEQSVAVQMIEYPKEEIRVADKYVALPGKTKSRVAREKKTLKRALSRKAGHRLWRGPFVRPTASPETSTFGLLRLYNNKKQSRHLGWDLDGQIGDPVASTQRGQVALVEDRYYSGRTILIDHGYGLFSMYFHLSATSVAQGELVEAGQKIGEIGESGRVTGPHLHFAIKASGVYVDPKMVLGLPLAADPLLSGTPKENKKD